MAIYFQNREEKELKEYQDEVDSNSELQQQMEMAAREFAEEEGHIPEDLEQAKASSNTSVQVNVVVSPYPYWVGIRTGIQRLIGILILGTINVNFILDQEVEWLFLVCQAIIILLGIIDRHMSVILHAHDITLITTIGIRTLEMASIIPIERAIL